MNRRSKINQIAEELISVGNCSCLVNDMKAAALDLRVGVPVRHLKYGHTGILQDDVSDGLQVHVKGGNVGQFFADPRFLRNTP